MDAMLQMLLLGLVMVCLLAVGIFRTCRGLGIRLGDSVREALLWSGGFIIYAVLDYVFLMH